ncbi:MAG: helix-turn-helix domain-containing protein [Actinomycetota bacterium]|nr:helix-turn-helix domain-containing protein [Actinomycetota bacterium]
MDTEQKEIKRVEPERFAQLPKYIQDMYGKYEDWISAIGRVSLAKIEADAALMREADEEWRREDERRAACEVLGVHPDYGLERERSADEVVKRIGQALRFERVMAGFTIESLARATGLSSATISRIERATRPARMDELAQIAHSLGKSIGAIFEKHDGRVCWRCKIPWRSHVRMCPDAGLIEPVVGNRFRGDLA